MSLALQISSSESDSGSLIVLTSPELFQLPLGQQEIMKIFSRKVANSMQGMCKFERGFEKLLPLFRGLVLLGKPLSLNLLYDVHQSQVFFTFANEEKKEVERFLSKVMVLLEKEVRFKLILEKVIENNRRHQAEQALLQASLHGISWD
jgi:hypothetical protein